MLLQEKLIKQGLRQGKLANSHPKCTTISKAHFTVVYSPEFSKGKTEIFYIFDWKRKNPDRFDRLGEFQ